MHFTWATVCLKALEVAWQSGPGQVLWALVCAWVHSSFHQQTLWGVRLHHGWSIRWQALRIVWLKCWMVWLRAVGVPAAVGGWCRVL